MLYSVHLRPAGLKWTRRDRTETVETGLSCVFNWSRKAGLSRGDLVKRRLQTKTAGPPTGPHIGPDQWRTWEQGDAVTVYNICCKITEGAEDRFRYRAVTNNALQPGESPPGFEGTGPCPGRDKSQETKCYGLFSGLAADFQPRTSLS